MSNSIYTKTMADKYYGINSKVIYKAVSSEFGEEINEKKGCRAVLFVLDQILEAKV